MCVKFSMDGVPRKLAAGGWGVCSEMPSAHYQSQAAACQFEPSRFAAQEMPVDKSVNNLPEEIDFG